MLLTDIFVAAGVVWAVAGYALALKKSETGRGHAHVGMLIVGLGLAVAWLAKGPIGILIPLFGIVPHRVVSGRAAAIGVRGWIVAGGVLALLGTPWFILISARDPAFPWFFFMHEHILRFFTAEAQRQKSVFYFSAVLLGGLFPASFLLPWAGKVTWPGLRPATREDRGTFLLGSLGVLTVLFFSVSRSKLATYIVPALPAFALIVGRALSIALSARSEVPSLDSGGAHTLGMDGVLDPVRARLKSRGGREAIRRPVVVGRLSAGLRLSLVVASAAGFGASMSVAWMWCRPIPPLARGPELIALAAVLLLLALGLGLPAAGGTTRVLRKGLVLAAAAVYLSLANLEIALERADPSRSVKAAARFIAGRAGPDHRIASFGVFLPGLTFYTQRRVAIVGGAGELAFGASLAPSDEWIIPEADLGRFLDGHQVYLAVSKLGVSEAIRRSSGRLRVAFDGPRYVVLSNDERPISGVSRRGRVEPHQMRQTFWRTRGWPGLQENAWANSGMFTTTPLIR